MPGCAGCEARPLWSAPAAERASRALSAASQTSPLATQEAVFTARRLAMQESSRAAPGLHGSDPRRPRLGARWVMRLYHVPGSRSTRVLWMLEEIGAPFELTVMTREERKTPEHISRHPLGRVPVVEFDDGRKLFESAAICIQLADVHPEAGLIPPVGSPDRGLVYQWSFFAMTELEPPVFQWMRARRGEADQTEPSERYHAAAAVLDAALADRDWLLGPFSVADVICAGVAGITRRAELTDEPERVRAYVERARARPANQRAASRADTADDPSAHLRKGR
jgi:glutathione S-transferase